MRLTNAGRPARRQRRRRDDGRVGGQQRPAVAADAVVVEPLLGRREGLDAVVPACRLGLEDQVVDVEQHDPAAVAGALDERGDVRFPRHAVQHDDRPAGRLGRHGGVDAGHEFGGDTGQLELLGMVGGPVAPRRALAAAGDEHRPEVGPPEQRVAGRAHGAMGCAPGENGAGGWPWTTRYHRPAARPG